MAPERRLERRRAMAPEWRLELLKQCMEIELLIDVKWRLNGV